MKSRYVASASLLLMLAGSACATAMPPKELIAAREAYARAQQGTTAKLDPAELHTAAKALAAAEGSFERDGDTASTRDLAYIAERRVQIANAKASESQANAAEEHAVSTMHAARAFRPRFNFELASQSDVRNAHAIR